MAMIKRIAGKITNIVKSDEDLSYIKKAKKQNLDELEQEEHGENNAVERSKTRRSI